MLAEYTFNTKINSLACTVKTFQQVIHISLSCGDARLEFILTRRETLCIGFI
jgi:hypothetical protein